ncbi:MAG: hypothetical protein ABI051_00405 [Vicinamibacterales bacterium]
MSTAPAWLTTFPNFLRHFPQFLAPSWRGWRSIAAALFGQTPEDPAFVLRVTGRSTLPLRALKALFAAIGRGAGKTFFAMVIAAYVAVGRVYRLGPGENVYVCIFSPTKRQSTIAFRYVLGLIKSVPSFTQMIVRETTDTIELSNGVIIETGVPDYRTVRGRSMVLAVVDEGAFLPTDDSAAPDTELLRALRPALARVPGSILLFVSSPYASRGELFRAFEQHYGKDASDTLVVRASTLDLNPTFDAAAIADAFNDDPVSAAAEYGAQFRSDVEALFTRDALKAVVDPGCLERRPMPSVRYVAFLDFAGGSVKGDSATLGIAHTDQATGQAVLDVVREVRPPFSPSAVIAEFARTCILYGCSSATADRWGGQFPVEGLSRFGVSVRPSERVKSDIYLELIPLVNSRRVRLLDEPRLLTQLGGLERRTARGGRDSIDHGPGGHDDLANAAAGALVLTGGTTQRAAYMVPCTGHGFGQSDPRPPYTPQQRYRLGELSMLGHPDYNSDPVARDHIVRKEFPSPYDLRRASLTRY